MKDMLDDIPDDNLKKKLQNYQEDPGEELWSRIRQNLPDSKISDRLKEYEESPDESVWTSIQSSLRFQHIINRINFAGYMIAGIAFLFVSLPWVTGKNNAQSSRDIVASEKNVASPDKDVSKSDVT